jgi:periplasmic protein TonB
VLLLLCGCGESAASRSPAELTPESRSSGGNVPDTMNRDPGLFCDVAHHDEPAASLEFAHVGKLGERLPGATRQPSEISTAIRAHSEDFKACYEKALQREPHAHGVVTTRLVIEPNGSTTDVCILSSSLDDAEALSCLIARFSKLSFDRADKKVTIVYPLQFDP